MTLLQTMDRDQKQRREALRLETRGKLRRALEELRPSHAVIVFGSLVKPGRFTETSDVDLALESEPSRMTVYQLIGLLSERLGRSVDVILLSESRFRQRIQSEGERWTLPA